MIPEPAALAVQGRIPAWSCHLLAGSIPRSVPAGRNWAESAAPPWGSYLQWDTVHTFAQGAVATPGQREREKTGVKSHLTWKFQGNKSYFIIEKSACKSFSGVSLVWEIYRSSEQFSTPDVAKVILTKSHPKMFILYQPGQEQPGKPVFIRQIKSCWVELQRRKTSPFVVIALKKTPLNQQENISSTRSVLVSKGRAQESSSEVGLWKQWMGSSCRSFP